MTVRTLKDHLSTLTYRQAVGLLKQDGEKLIQSGGLYSIDTDEQVQMNEESFTLTLGDARVNITLPHGVLHYHCNQCARPCEHAGAAFSLILEEKTNLGLAAPPPEAESAAEPLSEAELIEKELKERQERAEKERMRVQYPASGKLWDDYAVTNRETGKTYKVALRGWHRGESYCSCPDFKKNTLGTCKHIMHVAAKAKKRFPQSICNQSYQQQILAIHLLYGHSMELRLLHPAQCSNEIETIIKPIRNRPIEDCRDLLRRIRRLEQVGESVLIYPDAEEYIQQRLFKDRISGKITEIRNNLHNHPLRKTLLKVELLPYQLDGIAFAVGAGRAILADDMGLGKTLQGIGVAELLAREAGIERVLVVLPASLKSQWKDEIRRFSKRDCQMVLGGPSEHTHQYQSGAFFILCNYEQVLKDLHLIRSANWDLIILDESQRIKNWEAKTSQAIKTLNSRFALALTGTPIENRLDDLYSIMEFIDERRLGPRFLFDNHHRILNEKGKVLGYKNLTELKTHLAPVLLRRTRSMVMQELPPRTTEIIRIEPTKEQLDAHDGYYQTALMIVNKKFLTEMDLLRLQRALLMCRMSANSTYLVDKETHFSTKLERLDDLLEQFSQEPGRKVVLFSEWTTMLNLIEPLLKRHQLNFVRLDGSVPQKNRQKLVNQFQKDANCQFFLTTNAGATGLNLQAANTVVNVDLPWNPALLEQRIARAHRMGQQQPVQVYLLVTEQTLEERLLSTLSAKNQLSLAVLNPDTHEEEVYLESGIEELKKRLEILLGTKPEAAVDQTQQQAIEKQIAAQKQKVASAGGQLLNAALNFIHELIPEREPTPEMDKMAEQFMKKLTECMEAGENGELKLTVSLPDTKALSNFASAMARMVEV